MVTLHGKVRVCSTMTMLPACAVAYRSSDFDLRLLGNITALAGTEMMVHLYCLSHRGRLTSAQKQSGYCLFFFLFLLIPFTLINTHYRPIKEQIRQQLLQPLWQTFKTSKQLKLTLWLPLSCTWACHN